MKAMMNCGHAANATHSKTGQPVCAICSGLTPDADIVVATPDLTGRSAVCGIVTCLAAAPSSVELAFFEYRPRQEYDTYYCGCRGWD